MLKVQPFVIGAMLAAVPGAIYAHYVSFIDPTSFGMNESILLLSIIIVGGLGKHWGCIAGTVVLVLLPEGLRFVGFPGSLVGNLREMVFAVALLGFLALRTHRANRRGQLQAVSEAVDADVPARA